MTTSSAVVAPLWGKRRKNDDSAIENQDSSMILMVENEGSSTEK